MQKNNADLTNPIPAKEAPAKFSPELSSVLEEMENGFDIQPLDDIVQGEYIDFDDNAIYENEEETVTEDEAKPKRSIKKLVVNKLSRGAIFILLSVCMLIGLSVLLFNLDSFSHKAIAVYQKNGVTSIKLENDKIITLDEVRHITMSEDGSRLVYSQDTASKTGKYDIRVIDFSKRSSVNKKGSVIVSGTDSDWQTDKNISYVYYSKTEKKSVKYYSYSTQTNETDLVVSDSADFYTPPVGDLVYYTRETSDGKALFRKAFGEEAESIADINDIKSFSSNEVLEIFYTVKSDENDGTLSLFKISGTAAPVKISDKISEVYLDDYEVGGNLYYFIKTDADFNWQDVVDDNYADADSIMLKPDKSNYLVTKGFILKRTVLDEVAYNNAQKKYTQKLLRDEIREALNKTKFDLTVSAEYKIMVYDGKISKQLSSGVKLENLIDFSKNGAPRIVFSKKGVDLEKRLSMDSLYKTASKSGVDYAVDNVMNLLDDGYEITSSVKYAWFDGTKALEYEIDDVYDAAKAKYIFAQRDKLITAVQSDKTHYKLYCSQISSSSISKGVTIADNVTSYSAHGDALLYYKEAEDGTSTLYEYKNAKANAVCDNCVDYYVRENGEIVAFKGVFDDAILQSVDIILYKDNKPQTIDKNASHKHFLFGEAYFAYIIDYKTASASDSQSLKGGKLMIYSDGSSKTIDDNITDVFNIRAF